MSGATFIDPNEVGVPISEWALPNQLCFAKEERSMLRRLPSRVSDILLKYDHPPVKLPDENSL